MLVAGPAGDHGKWRIHVLNSKTTIDRLLEGDDNEAYLRDIVHASGVGVDGFFIRLENWCRRMGFRPGLLNGRPGKDNVFWASFFYRATERRGFCEFCVEVAITDYFDLSAKRRRLATISLLLSEDDWHTVGSVKLGSDFNYAKASEIMDEMKAAYARGVECSVLIGLGRKLLKA